MKMTVLSALFLFALVTRGALGTGLDSLSSVSSLDLRCKEQKTCSACIQSLGCSWCSEENLPLESKRCLSHSSQVTQCKGDIENPQGSIRKENLDESEGINGNRSNKIRPQVVQLSLRKGESHIVTGEYTDEKNRPLDLYVVMDLSCSMKPHTDKVSTLATSLVKSLQNLTSDLRIGFGSFVDKPLAPFGFLKPHDKPASSNCSGESVQHLPYGFKNNLPLTENITQFINTLKTAGISSNIDFPEGTLDGLLQSIVCTEKIGWRSVKGNRKLLVISTDGSYHMAGDGKLVGVVLPHDGRCYVDDLGKYTLETVLDYPSISLVRQKIKENDVFVIFAVTQKVNDTYQALSRQLQSYAVTQSIDDQTSITSVIENQYKKLVNSVTFVSQQQHSKYVDVKMSVLCPGEKEFSNDNTCKKVGPGVTVHFKIEVTLKDCPSNPAFWKSNVTINPLSSDDKMILQLSMLCDCNCESDKPIVQLPREIAKCSGNGHVECGICACNFEFDGPFCNCTKIGDNHSGKASCRDPKTGDECNKRGNCDSCGKCVCNPVNGNSDAFSGNYCECDNTNCPMESTDNGLCNQNGTHGSQGHCECSECLCEKFYGGPRCECPMSEESCVDPNSNKICNGKLCECGKCHCGSSNTGEFCEIQYAKLNGSCEASTMQTRRCIKCLVSRYTYKETDGRKTELCEEECAGVSTVFKQRIDTNVEEDEKVCKDHEIAEGNCRVEYVIKNQNINGTIFVEIESSKSALEKCPKPPPLVPIMMGIIGAMVVIGLVLLLLWKLVVHIQDKREYERFEKSIHETSWDAQLNPLYKSVTTQFTNPAFSGQTD